MEHNNSVSKVRQTYTVAAPCYALYWGPKRNKQSRWVPAVVSKVSAHEVLMLLSPVFPRGPNWRCHIDQLCPCYAVEEDADSGEAPRSSMKHPKSNHLDRVRGMRWIVVTRTPESVELRGQ